MRVRRRRPGPGSVPGSGRRRARLPPSRPCYRSSVTAPWLDSEADGGAAGVAGDGATPPASPASLPRRLAHAWERHATPRRRAGLAVWGAFGVTFGVTARSPTRCAGAAAAVGSWSGGATSTTTTSASHCSRSSAPRRSRATRHAHAQRPGDGVRRRHGADRGRARPAARPPGRLLGERRPQERRRRRPIIAAGGLYLTAAPFWRAAAREIARTAGTVQTKPADSSTPASSRHVVGIDADNIGARTGTSATIWASRCAHSCVFRQRSTKASIPLHEPHRRRRTPAERRSPVTLAYGAAGLPRLPAALACPFRSFEADAPRAT